MPEIVPGRPEALKGSAAAAVLLMLFDEDEAAQILSRLEPEEVRQLGYAMYDVADVDPEEVNEALDHFVTKAKKRTTIGYGATRHIRGAMTKALGEERAETILARITPPTRSTQLEMLKWMDAKEIAVLIEMEHPQIMAIVLAHLEAPVAADVLQLLPVEYQEEIVYRIATLGPVSNEALDDLEQLLLRGPVKKQGAASQRGGTIEAAAIMNNVRKDNEQRIMKAVAKRDKMIAQTIEEEMFVFDNLIDMDDKNLGTLMRTVDSQVLVVALKGANDMLKGKIFSCMSARAAQAIADEIEERGPIRLAEVIDAQKLIIATARRMADAGTIMLGGKGMTLSKIWGAEAVQDVASVSMAGVGQVASNGFRSLYAALPGGQADAPHSPLHVEPEQDPIDQAHMAGFSQGFEEGYRAASDDRVAEIEARDRLTAALDMLAPAPSGMLSTMLSATVVRLVEQIVGEVEIDIERLVQRCDTVAAFIEDNSDKSALHLHPDDATLLEGEAIGVPLVTDKGMQRGCVRLETADGWVEDGPDVRLSRLRALMDDMEGKA